MKKEQREIALSARRALSAEERARYNQKIGERLLSLPELKTVRTVLSYLASWDEADLAVVNETLAARGCVVAFPVCLGAGHMEAYVPESVDALEIGAYGIKRPVVHRSRKLQPEEIELVLTPCVAFDARNNRLGHGAGYYDRYLPRCGNVLCVAAAFETQKLESVFCDSHDRKMDIIVTESAVYR